MSRAKMHICFDLRPMQIGHQNRGIGMHIKSLLENLPDDGSILFSYYHFADSNPIINESIKAPHGQMIATPRPELAIKKPSHLFDTYKIAFHRFSGLRHKGITRFVQFDASLGLPKIHGVKTVIIAYDLIPLIIRNQYLPGVGHALSHSVGKKMKLRAAARSIYYQQKYHRACLTMKQADLILSISDATRQSYIDILHIKKSHIITIPLAPVDFGGQEDSSIVSTIQKPYLFYIGGTDFRKRVNHIVKVFNVLKSRGHDIQLVLAGNEFKKLASLPDVDARKLISSSPFKNDIRLAGYVSDKQKRSLLSNAQAFVFTTAYEGFGLPVLEAMANGCPVVCYDNSSLKEVAGDAAVLVDDGDYVTIAKQVAKIIESDELRRDLKERGLVQAQRYSWKSYTKNFLEVLSDQF